MSNIVYHYTSVSGLNAILSGSSIRLTDYRYLNDEDEINHGVKSFIKAVEDFETTGENETEREMFNFIISTMKDPFGSSSFFVTSFCKNGDALTQWLSYCPSQGGYSIGFDRTILEEYLQTQSEENTLSSYQPVDVKYEKEPSFDLEKLFQKLVQKGLFRFSLSELIEMTSSGDIDKFQTKLEFYGDLLVAISNEILSDIVAYKNPSFFSEKEFRIARMPTASLKEEKRVFFEKGSILVPAILFRFPPKAIKKIVIGPMKHQDLAEQALNILKDSLSEHSYNFDIVKSSIPFRTF